MSKTLATKQVAAVLVGLGVVFTLAFATMAKAQTTTTTTTSDASTLSALQAQVQALLAQIASLQGSSTTTGGSCYTFTLNEQQGSTGTEVQQIQMFLNAHGFTVATTGAGSPGNETTYFGPATKAAVIAFQDAYAANILTPEGLTAGTGNWYAGTRAEANALCSSTTTTTTTTGTTTGGGVTISAATEPANSLAPMNATRVPFTTFTLTNTSGAAVTVTGITIQRTGLANDNAFAGVVLLDQNGLQLGNAQTFNANHQAVIGGTFTLNAGQSETFTVAGNMETTGLGNAGQVASLSVVGVNTSVPVTGTLPITGASQTINESLTIGSATISNSGYDPGSGRSESIGTTGLIFSAVHITTQNEDQKLYSITWNQTGSVGSTDLSNLVTIVNGTSYPVTVDATGKYFTSTFPGGILIPKGTSVDAYIQGDITGSDASGRTIEFDIYRPSDIYLVGQTYGYGITPTFTGSGTYTAGNNSNSGFQPSGNPAYFGATVTVTGGTLSTVSTASTVSPQNIAINVPNQVLGGFTTDFTGEPVTVQTIPVNVSTSSGATQLQNVTLVDQNGNVVAGPVNSVYVSNGQSTITFNTAVTFPVGAMTYTVEGTVESGADTSSTYALSTSPNDWTGAVGQTSGTYVTLPTTTITMATMTVQAGSLTISASASPAASTITPNQNNYTLANIVLDASQSGEDVRLSALPVIVSGTSTYETSTSYAGNLQANLTNCQLYNNGTPLNSNSIGTGQWSVATLTGTNELSTAGVEANFVFNNSLTIPKGTTVTLALECNIGGSVVNGEEFSAGVDSNYNPTVTGATSGNTITPLVNPGTSGIMTVGTAAMSITSPTQTYTQVAGGTTGVTLGSFTLQPTSGQVNLQNIALELNSNDASSSDLVNGQVQILNGTTVIGTVNFAGVTPNASKEYVATTTISNVNLPQNVQTTLTLQGNISPIGTGQSGTSGHEILVGLSDAQGVSGNTSVHSGPSTQPSQGSGVGIFRSYPTQVSLVSLPASGVSGDRQLIEFSVTANSQNAVGIDQFVFSFASSTGVTISNPALYYGSSASPSNLVENGLTNATVYTVDSNAATTTLATPLEIPAGQTWYFLLQAGTIAYGGTNSTYNITTTLKGDSLDLSPVMVAANAAATSTYNFVWSPNSTTTAVTSVKDWTNGYGVNGLPSFGISSSRAQ